MTGSFRLKVSPLRRNYLSWSVITVGVLKFLNVSTGPALLIFVRKVSRRLTPLSPSHRVFILYGSLIILPLFSLFFLSVLLRSSLTFFDSKLSFSLTFFSFCLLFSFYTSRQYPLLLEGRLVFGWPNNNHPLKGPYRGSFVDVPLPFVLRPLLPSYYVKVSFTTIRIHYKCIFRVNPSDGIKELFPTV